MSKFIMVDMDDECIVVCPGNEESDDSASREFWLGEYGSKAEWKFAAEAYAKAEAKRIGADWGTNY